VLSSPRHSPSLCSDRLPRPRCTLFPYTTLFRSAKEVLRVRDGRVTLSRNGVEEMQDAESPLKFIESYRQRFASPEIAGLPRFNGDRKSTRLNSSHVSISYAVFCLTKKNRAPDMH